MPNLIVRTLLALIFFFPLPLTAAQRVDPVLVTIDQALQEYADQHYSSAADSLAYAGQLIRQQKGEAIGKTLPAPQEGWTAREVISKNLGGAVFNGGLSAERLYRRGDSSLKITILTDSPMLQSMIMLFGNSIFTTANKTLELIHGQRAVVSHEGNNGTIHIMADQLFLITLEGNDMSRDELLSYASQIDMENLLQLR
ncbi:MAG: hypothetical protein H8E79_06525 [Desulfobulbaceae bacterium]|uniref:Uncharacterized protein n=1 Tax=Candidatus Desulfatifera sulfidica TaxID=2841691 RepID=A0A8J6NC23_9BACT|nr:hypothetical protein [Candidatus Desulfatifera sulfidica]